MSVSVETDPNLDQEPHRVTEVLLLEAAIFASLAAGVIANLPKPLARELSTRLAQFARPMSLEDVPGSVDGFDLVLPRPERDRKGLEGTLTMKGSISVAKLKPRGFRLFGREVQGYSQTATMAVLLYLLAGTPHGRHVMLVEAAHTVGTLGEIGAFGLTTHANGAQAALDAAAEAADAESSRDQ